MGNSLSTQRGLWWSGQNPYNQIQDDVVVLANATNGFGYRPDEAGDTTAAAATLAVADTTATASGVITTTADRDYYSFTTTGGAVSFTGAVAQYGAMLDLKLELRDANDNVVAAADTASLGETVSATVGAGTYYIVVASHGGYGDIGQYTLTGTVPDDGGSTPATPVASIAGPITVAEGGSVALSGAASTGTGISYAWDLDADGVYGETGAGASRGNETGATPTFSAVGLDGNGTFSISLRVTDSSSQTSTTSAAISITNVAPTLSLGGASSVSEGSTYTLSFSATDPGPDTITSWLVNWGDGNTQTASGSLSSVTHVYADNGSYTITASATDEDGTYAFSPKSVTVTNIAPSLSLGGATSVNEGAPYTLSLGTTDPGPDTVSQWVINWGDGSSNTYAGNVSSAAHTYADQGAYTVNVSATDEDGTYAASPRSVTVQNVAPTIALSGAATTAEGAVYSLTLGTVTDPGADMVTSWLVAWGDGTTNTYASGGAKTHTYADNFIGNIVVSLVDEDGTHIGATRAISVTNVAPTFTITGANSVSEGTAYALSFAATDPGADTITGWSVNWGDGATSTFAAGASAASHVYTDGTATRSIVVSATDEDGTHAAAARAVTVQNVAPTLIVTGNSVATVGQGYTLQLSAGDVGADTLTLWTVDWGDGQTQTVVGSATSVSHTFSATGTRSIVATATDEDGSYQAGPVSVTVTDAPVDVPVLSVSGGSSVPEGSLYTLNLASSLAASSWTISWGDGVTETVSGAAALATHRYADSATTRTIQATAVVNGNTFAAAPKTVTVTDVAPTVSISGAATSAEGAVYTVTFGAIVDPGKDTLGSWVIDWGDGTTQSLAAALSTASHVYADGPSAYVIQLSGTDEDGTHLAGSAAVNVTDVAPVIGLGGTGVGSVGTAYVLTLSTGDVGADTAASWSIDWADGSVETVAGALTSATHTYVTAGAYTMTATLINDDGNWPAAQAHTVTIGAKPGPAPITDETAPTVAVISVPSTVQTPDGTPLTFVVRYTDASLDLATIDGALTISGPVPMWATATLSDVVGTGGGSYVATYQLAAPAGGWRPVHNGSYTVALAGGVVADAYGNATPGQAIGTVTVAIGSLPDLEAVVTRSPKGSLIGGTDAILSYKIFNRGTLPFNGTTSVAYYLSADETLDADDVLVTTQSKLLKLKPNAAQSFSAKLRLPSDMEGSYRLLAVVDSDDAVSEMLESNNVGASAEAFALARPFVDVSTTVARSPAGEIVGGTRTTAKAKVTNNGNVTFRGNATVAYYLSTDGAWDANDRLVGSQTMRLGIGAGGYKSLAAGLALPADVQGTFYWLAIADLDGSIADPDDANNVGGSAVAFNLTPPFVDLSPVVTQSPAGELVGGSKAKVVTTIANHGNVSYIGTATVSYYLSTDQTWDSNDRLVGSQTPRLNVRPTTARTLSAILSLPVDVEGAYQWLAVVEANGVIAESTAANNAATGSTLYLTPPFVELRTESLALSAIELVPGTATTASLTLKNWGNVTMSAPTEFKLYLSRSGTIDDESTLVNARTVTVALKPSAAGLFRYRIVLPLAVAEGDWQLIAQINDSVVVTSIHMSA
jgi:hypothetical protein